MVLTATEFKTNFGKYMDMLSDTAEELIITRNGHRIALVSKPATSAVDELANLLGKAPRIINYDELKYEALKEKYESTM